jgi:hypothetical protein
MANEILAGDCVSALERDCRWLHTAFAAAANAAPYDAMSAPSRDVWASAIAASGGNVASATAAMERLAERSYEPIVAVTVVNSGLIMALKCMRDIAGSAGALEPGFGLSTRSEAGAALGAHVDTLSSDDQAEGDETEEELLDLARDIVDNVALVAAAAAAAVAAGAHTASGIGGAALAALASLHAWLVTRPHVLDYICDDGDASTAVTVWLTPASSGPTPPLEGPLAGGAPWVLCCAIGSGAASGFAESELRLQLSSRRWPSAWGTRAQIASLVRAAAQESLRTAAAAPSSRLVMHGADAPLTSAGANDDDDDALPAAYLRGMLLWALQEVQRLLDARGSCSVLVLGTGLGLLPAALQRWAAAPSAARRHSGPPSSGRAVRLTCVDRNANMLIAAHRWVGFGRWLACAGSDASDERTPGEPAMTSVLADAVDWVPRAAAAVGSKGCARDGGSCGDGVDVVLVDLYSSGTLPAGLQSPDWWAALRCLLRPEIGGDGVGPDPGGEGESAGDSGRAVESAGDSGRAVGLQSWRICVNAGTRDRALPAVLSAMQTGLGRAACAMAVAAPVSGGATAFTPVRGSRGDPRAAACEGGGPALPEVREAAALCFMSPISPVGNVPGSAASIAAGPAGAGGAAAAEPSAWPAAVAPATPLALSRHVAGIDTNVLLLA